MIEILEENSLDEYPEQSLEKSPKRPLEEIPGESKKEQLEEITEKFPLDCITIVEIRKDSHEEKSQEGQLKEIPEESQEKPQAEQKNQNQTRAQDIILTPWGISSCLVGLLAVLWAIFGV